MRNQKRAILILFLAVTLMMQGCSFKDQSLDNEIIKQTLSTDAALEAVLLSIQIDIQNIGLEVREITVDYSGIDCITGKSGICTVIACKEYNGLLDDFFYEGGKVELETITFTTKGYELVINQTQFRSGRSVVIGANKLNIEDWTQEIESIVDSFILSHNDEIYELVEPVLYLHIINDRCVVNLRDENAVLIIEEYDLVGN